MLNKFIVGLITLIVSVAFGVVISPEVLKPIVDNLTPISPAKAEPLNPRSLAISDKVSDTSVGALRPPSAYFKADRTCYYCHGFHGSDFKSTVLLTAPVSQPRKHDVTS